jgi:hypothetical protein
LNMNDDLEPFRMPSIQRSALPAYLHWICDQNSKYYQFYNPPGGIPRWDHDKPLLNTDDCHTLIRLCQLHFLHHPLFPSIIFENNEAMAHVYETEEEIYCHAVKDFLDFCMKDQNPHLFR